MGARFTYFGFEYEVLEDKKNEVALIDAISAHGRTIIPKEVEYNGQKYAVTQITGKTVHYSYLQKQEDKRKKPITQYADEHVGAFQYKVHGKYKYSGWGYNNNPLDVVIPNSVTCIGEKAFFGCRGLTSVTIPSSVKTIGENSFNYYRDLRYKMALKTVKIENEEGEVIIHPDAFPPTAKIEYVGKNKPASQTKKEAKPATAVTIDLEKLIQAALADGIVTDKERSILIKKIKEAGGDVDEFEMLLDARIFEATKKTAKVETPKAASKPAKTETKAETAKVASKPAKTETAKPAASAKGGLTVGSLAEAFKSQFGAVLRIYNGRSKADDGMSLQEVGLKQEINTTFDGKQTVGAFIEQMAKAGLKVKVYTCDEWVAVLDELTLEQAGKVKKNAKKADMDALKAK